MPMTIYNTAWFDPTNVTNVLINLFSVPTLNACACQCSNNSMCITGSYFGINQTCVLFSAQLSQGQVRLITNKFASVFTFPNKTINIDSTNPPAIIEWLFDGNLNDVYGLYNGHLVNTNGASIQNSSTLWVSPGYTGSSSAVYFSCNIYSVVDQYLNLLTISFTISAWIWIPFTFTSDGLEYFPLFVDCESATNDKCLHIVIGNGFLRLGFFSDDLIGNTNVNSKQWHHVAYVYDRSTSQQLVYLNGNLDGNRTTLSSYNGNASQLVFGAVPLFPSVTCRNGYVEKLIFVSRVKNGSELLDEATLVAYYPFDGSYVDAGPNSMDNTINVSTTFASGGRFNQALVFNSTNSSYFQTTGFYYLGQTNYSYSFSLWIYPFVNNGTILQLSSSNGWCMPMIGFNKFGYLTIQSWGSHGIYVTSSTSEMLSLNEWSYVTMTYSTQNGIRLFINGSLINTYNKFSDYSASGEMCTITVGTCLYPTTCGINITQIVVSQFRGKIDELKMFSRELSTNEVNQLMSSP